MSLSSDPQKYHSETLPTEPLPIIQPFPNGPSIMDSNPRGEPLQKQTQTELCVYSQRKNNQNGESQLNRSQTTPPNGGPLNETGISLPNLCSTPKSSHLDIASHEFNVPIALRKDTCSCTMHPITKYVSSYKLSQNYIEPLLLISLVFHYLKLYRKPWVTLMKDDNHGRDECS